MGTPETTYERLDAKAYASRVGCSSRTAYRDLERLLARQSDPNALRVELVPTRIGSGATRHKMVVLYPTVGNDNDR